MMDDDFLSDSVLEIEEYRSILKTALWPRVDEFVNGPEPVDDTRRKEYRNVRRLLEQTLKGVQLNRKTDITLALRSTKDGVSVGIKAEESQPDPNVPFIAALVLLQDKALRPLLRRCDQCTKYFLGNRAHRRENAFCDTNCRTKFHRAQRGKGAHAEYMKKYRANPQVKKRSKQK